jgi:CheY-like chemotaxis protein
MTHPTRLVVAEDHPDIQLVLRLWLKREGFEVTVASNGVEALARVAERRPDAVLLDWAMPEMDGLEACTRLKADPATCDIPVIFLTGRSQSSEVQRGLALGAVGVIAKPFDAFMLGATVRELLNRM